MNPDEAFVRGAFHEHARLVKAAHVWGSLISYFGIVSLASLAWTLTAKYAGEELASLIFGLAGVLALWPAGAIGLRISWRVQHRFCKRYPHVPPAPSATWCNGSAPCEHCGAWVTISPYVPTPRPQTSALERYGRENR